MLSVTFIVSLLVLVCSCSGEGNVNTGWQTEPGQKGAWSASEDHHLKYVKAYVRCTKGDVKFFYGDLGKLTYGWQRCDGSQGTPDLRDRFPVGAGTSFPYWSRGGKRKIELQVWHLPAHKHTIWSSDMWVSSSGAHAHNASGEMEMAGAHWHGAGNLTADLDGEHWHNFWGQTNQDEGGHVHWEINLSNSEAGEHSHQLDFWSMPNGAHAHPNNFTVNMDDSNHTHPVEVDVQPAGEHTHSVDIDDFEFYRPPHWHGVGTYSIDDHFDTHKHQLWGETSHNGKHSHWLQGWTKMAGPFPVQHNLTVTMEGNHTHDSGSYMAESSGWHKHWVNEFDVLDVLDHNHQITGYAPSGWHTQNRIWNIPLDLVDSDKQWNVDTSDFNGTDITIPAHDTKWAGNHTHTIDGDSGEAGWHTHELEGDIWLDKKHWHQIDMWTKNNSNHWHTVQGWTADYNLTLEHTLRGNSSYDAGFRYPFTNVSGQTDEEQEHDHNATATMDSSGMHTHGLDGRVLGVGNHMHRILNQTGRVYNHSHMISGHIGAEDDGYHKHTVHNRTTSDGDHDHAISGFTSMARDHDHPLTITVDDSEEHIHMVSGKTRPTGEGRPIDTTPPYVALWMVCCTSDKSGSWSFSESGEWSSTTAKPWVTETEEPWDTTQPGGDGWSTEPAKTTTTAYEKNG